MIHGGENRRRRRVYVAARYAGREKGVGSTPREEARIDFSLSAALFLRGARIMEGEGERRSLLHGNSIP